MRVTSKDAENLEEVKFLRNIHNYVIISKYTDTEKEWFEFRIFVAKWYYSIDYRLKIFLNKTKKRNPIYE